MSAKKPRRAAENGIAPWSLSAAETRRLVDSATWHSVRVSRARGVRQQDRGDLRQDVLVDILTRLSRFDPTRSPFGAFVDFVADRAAGRLASRYLGGLHTLEVAEPLGPGHDPDQNLSRQDAAWSEWATAQRLALSLALQSPAGAAVGHLIAECLDPKSCASGITRWRHRRTLRLLLLLHGVDRPP
jgi:hypothetical protein